MTETTESPKHFYTVELRFSGDQLQPAEISRRLGLTPTRSRDRSAGEALVGKPRPYWGFTGHGEDHYQEEWTSFQEGLEFLLSILASRKSEIQSLAREFDGVWWCGHFQSGFDGGPTLSPALLVELGSYGIPLSIDNYFFDD